MSLQFGSLLAGSIINGDGVFLARDRAVDRTGDSDPRLSFGPRLRAGHRRFIPLGKLLTDIFYIWWTQELLMVSKHGSTLVWLS